MRDFASCFSEHAVKVSDSTCSGSSSSSGKSSSVIDSSSLPASSSARTSVTGLYRANLSTQKDVLIKVTWARTHVGGGPVALSLGVDDDPFAHHWAPAAIHSLLLRKKKGSRSYVGGSTSPSPSPSPSSGTIGLYWDYSLAKFSTASGPEPVSDFYVVVVVDAELALVLGDPSAAEFVKRLNEGSKINIHNTAEFSLVSLREQVLGHAVYSTKARFGGGNKEHDIVIRCKGDCSSSGGGRSDDSELVVSVDRKRVVQVRSLHWNFRGNQTIFIDGSPVDMTWDVRDWWFSSPQGYAVFMFRKRSALESRLWFEEEMLLRERGLSGFSLLIQAFKSPS